MFEEVSSVTSINNTSSTGPGSALKYPRAWIYTFVSKPGTSATVNYELLMDNGSWVQLGTSGSISAVKVDTFQVVAPNGVRANLSAASGNCTVEIYGKV